MIRDTAATALTVLGILGLAVRFVLLPYLRDHLVGPVKEVQKQVTENHHATPEQPTLPDKLDDLATQLRALAHVMDVHMEWSEEQVNITNRKIKALRKAQQRQTNGRNHDGASRPTP